jgi:alginate O-acetyltransferase complex protein AlgI
MLFNSWGYLLFIALAVPLHWLLPHRYRLWLFATGSVAFYGMWRWEFCFLMAFSAVVDFVSAGQIARREIQWQRKSWLLASLIVNLGLLGFFKYTYFVVDNVRLVADAAGLNLSAPSDLGVRIILPLGISFYTFQTISYTIDVYRRVIPPSKSFLAFFTYVTFWPQLIAGPILRAGEVMSQLVAPRRLERGDLGAGLLLMMSGLFKKVVLADTIAPMVDHAFGLDPTVLSGFDVWAATCLFGFQIYFDFSGYSDVAIGTARILGIRFPDNFNWPYLATSPRDFWRRWHISLSAWIRDYLYLPLTGQPFRTKSTDGIAVATEDSSGSAKATRALFLTWFIMGLWHGAGWNFALWGLYHAVLVWAYRWVRTPGWLIGFTKAPAWLVLFLLVMAGWIPFRAGSLTQTVQMFSTLVTPSSYGLAARALNGYYYLTTITVTLAMLGMGWVLARYQRTPLPQRVVNFATFASAATMAFFIITYLRPVRQFIYFQF